MADQHPETGRFVAKPAQHGQRQLRNIPPDQLVVVTGPVVNASHDKTATEAEVKGSFT